MTLKKYISPTEILYLINRSLIVAERMPQSNEREYLIHLLCVLQYELTELFSKEEE